MKRFNSSNDNIQGNTMICSKTYAAFGIALAGILALSLSPQHVAAQMDRQQDAQPATPREAAPIDLTGYWISLIVEDWHWRMVTPPKENYAGLRRVLKPEANAVAEAWDAEDPANACKHFGAAGLIRNPLRVHFSWDDDRTLRMETDHGMQTRIFRFPGSSTKTSSEPTLPGDSVAEWHLSGLKVVTNNLAPGYLRKNGIPYSVETTLTEYFDVYSALDESWLTVTTVVEDPVYLNEEFITSTDFKKLPDGSSWHPVSCGES